MVIWGLLESGSDGQQVCSPPPPGDLERARIKVTSRQDGRAPGGGQCA